MPETSAEDVARHACRKIDRRRNGQAEAEVIHYSERVPRAFGQLIKEQLRPRAGPARNLRPRKEVQHPSAQSAL